MATSDIPPASPAPVPPPAPAPAKKSNTLVIVLCVVFGILFLMLASCVGTCIYVGKKAKAYAKDTEKNPAISQIAMVATFTPGLEVVSKDLDAGTIVIKNKKTGETVKFDSKDFSQEKMTEMIEKMAKGKTVDTTPDARTVSATGETAKAEAAEPAASEPPAPAEPVANETPSADQATTLKSFRSDFPVYAGSDVTTIEASQNTFAGVSTSQHVFETSDAPAKVAAFYEKKLAANGYTVLASENGSDSDNPRLTRVFQKTEVNGTVSFEARLEDGKTHVEVSQVVLKQQ